MQQVLLILSILVIVLTSLLIWRRESWLRGLVLVRVPLLFGLALFLVPAAALGFHINMLANLFALSRGRAVFTIILLGLLAAWLCGMSGLLIWEYAPQRMHHLTLRLSPFWQNRRILRVLPFTVLALPLMTVIWRNVENQAPRLGPMVLGGIAALLVVGLVVLLRAVVLDRLEAFITDRVVARFLQWIPRSIWAGYIEVEEAGKMHFRAGHGTATAILIVLAMAYWYGDLFLRPGQMEGWQLPALAYLLVLLMLLVSLLSGTSFFLDRFRLPLLLSLILWSFLSYGLNTDHTFPVQAVSPSGLDIPSAGESIEPWLAGEEEAGREKPTLLVVCASGGGIQASAWTARLLTWLQEDLGESFTRSIRLISSVSGGSLGTLYFLEAFEEKRGAPAPQSLEAIRRASSSSSLSETAWGLVFPDFQRAFFRFFVNPAIDRASAMEQAWRLALRLPKRRPIDTRLSQWTAQVRAGELPATVFNSFIVETGERMLFNTVDIPMTRRARTFAKLYGQGQALDVDIDVITAARLSATFAYVTPIARAQWQGAQPASRPLATDHLADGGYFDNFGVLTAVEWIQALLADPRVDEEGRTYRERVGRIVILEIRAFGDPAPEMEAGDLSQDRSDISSTRTPGRVDSPCDWPPEPWGSDHYQEGRGWFYAWAGPIHGLLAMRTSTQIARNDTEVCLLRELYPDLIERVIFQPTGGEWPLSWHLSAKQIRELDAQRDQVLKSSERKRLGEWLEESNQ